MIPNDLSWLDTMFQRGEQSNEFYLLGALHLWNCCRKDVFKVAKAQDVCFVQFKIMSYNFLWCKYADFQFLPLFCFLVCPQGSTQCLLLHGHKRQESHHSARDRCVKVS